MYRHFLKRLDSNHDFPIRFGGVNYTYVFMLNSQIYKKGLYLRIDNFLYTSFLKAVFTGML